MSLNIKNTFKGYITIKGDDYTLKHNPAEFYRIVPYTTKLETNDIEKIDFRSFDGIIGHCYRTMIKKELPDDLPETSYSLALKKRITATVLEKVKMEPELSDRFMTMIDSMFFNGDELAKYSPESQAYLFWKQSNPGLENIADFIYEVFVSGKVAAEWKSDSGFTEDIFQKLMNISLPRLKDIRQKKEKTDFTVTGYRIQNPSIITLFEQDFNFLYTHDKQGFLKESDKLFKFYYFLYVVQMGFSLNNFFTDNGQLKPLYFTLESETVSENRKTVKQGWRLTEPKIANLMSHSVAVDILNKLELNEGHGYNYVEMGQLYDGFTLDGKMDIVEDMQELIDIYRKAVAPETKSWDDFESELERINRTTRYNPFEKRVIEFFQRIEFQFEHSSRKSKRKAFSNWFIFFCKQNFLKNRGRNGYILNLSQEMLIFLTRMCIGTRAKIRLNELMSAFQERGLYFDEATKKAMIDIYEKINVIEKKSDSGDAQYIRQIL
ncbi:DNA phosphorothioation-dependent restriction protein DptG [Pedobacter terrae]|uniref:DNA phosphorothioation-dependent restriction protein DptG n=1 Tax=Pedobacter terrae TaxID=405671 RepID=A0A1G7Q4V4_9SPHI|nr:DNA phosphorothioation-dependent restriction protein DptG [Pedobacter terrae]SDF93531.1 DNA phosphorothioation-dependent restriction protein DptG [Pedobacter terrae]